MQGERDFEPVMAHVPGQSEEAGSSMKPVLLECEHCGCQTEWLTTREIRLRLGLSEAALCRWIHNRGVHARRLPNNRWLLCWPSVVEAADRPKRAGTGKEAPTWSVTDKRIKQAIDYIQKNLGGKMTVREIAKEVAMSWKHFERVFRKETGLSPKGYLRFARVQKVKDLLADPNSRVTEVGFAVGYADLSHFSRDFKRLAGLSPKAYQRSARKS